MAKFKTVNLTDSQVHVREIGPEVPSTVSSKPTRLLRLGRVLELFPVSRSSWYAGIASGIYPQPVKLSARSVAWPEDVIQALIAQKSTSARNAVVI